MAGDMVWEPLGAGGGACAGVWARAAPIWLAVPAQTVSPATDATPTGSVAGNLAATTFATGTGQIGRRLGLRDEWGLQLGIPPLLAVSEQDPAR